MTWLHDLDTLRSLSEESGPIAHWARLQRVARADGGPPPLDDATLGAGLALDPSRADAVAETHDASVGWVLHHSMMGLGIAPSPGWAPALTDRLSTPHGAAAASTLTVLGALQREHLTTVLAHDRDDAVLPAWALATTPPEDLDATARSVVDALAAAPDHALSCLVQTLKLLTPGHPRGAPADPVAAAEYGADAAGRPLAVRVPRGSTRSQASALLRSLGERVDGAVGSLIRALGARDGGPPVHSSIIAAASWAAHFESSGDPVSDALDRGSRRPSDVAAARGAAVAAPETVASDLDAALCVGFLDDPEVARRLLHAEAMDVGVFWVRQAAAARHSEPVVAMLTDPDRRAEALTLAAFAPTEGMLEALLRLSVPADPQARAYLAEALLRMGVPVVLPTVRALLPHLEPSEVPELAHLALALYNQEL